MTKLMFDCRNFANAPKVQLKTIQVVRSCEMSRCVDWWSVTGGSGQAVGPLFKGETDLDCLDFFTLVDGTDRLSRNVGNKLPINAA